MQSFDSNVGSGHSSSQGYANDAAGAAEGAGAPDSKTRMGGRTRSPTEDLGPIQEKLNSPDTLEQARGMDEAAEAAINAYEKACSTPAPGDQNAPEQGMPNAAAPSGGSGGSSPSSGGQPSTGAGGADKFEEIIKMIAEALGIPPEQLLAKIKEKQGGEGSAGDAEAVTAPQGQEMFA
jgi:hypothetical protein